MQAKWSMAAVAAGVLAVAAGTAEGGASAVFRTETGEFRVVLDVAGRPLAVAAFAGLADGSLRWVDMGGGPIRGGDGEDAFFDGFEAYTWDGSAVTGGRRAVVGADGTTNRVGPGFFVLNDEGGAFELEEGAVGFNTFWVPGWYCCPFEGGGLGGVSFVRANGLFAWPAFGHVAADGMEAFRAFCLGVESNGAAKAEIALDWSELTAAESNALSEARARLPVAWGVETGFGETWKEMGGMMPERSQLLVEGAGESLAHWNVYQAGWNEDSQEMPFVVGWDDIGESATGRCGFASFSAVEYPEMGGALPRGKWRLLASFSDVTYQYWLDFDGATGMWAEVVGGEPGDAGELASIKKARIGGNTLQVEFSTGEQWMSCFLRREGEETEGTLMAWMFSPFMGYVWDFGTYEIGEGWGEKGEGGQAKDPMREAPSKMLEADEVFDLRTHTGRAMKWKALSHATSEKDGRKTERFGRLSDDEPESGAPRAKGALQEQKGKGSKRPKAESRRGGQR